MTQFHPLLHKYLRLLGLCGSLLCIGVASSSEISLPLRLPITLLQTSLSDALGIHDNLPTELFRQGDCRFIQLTGLALEPRGQRLWVTTQANLKFGPEWFGSCYGAITWKGQARFELEPYITPGHLLRYRVLDTELIDDQGNKSLTAEVVWKLMGRIMRPRLETFQIDLRPPRTEITNVLHNFVPEAQVEQIDAILASARSTTLQISQDNLNIPLVIDVPDQYLRQLTPTPSLNETPLSSDELAEFEQLSQAWDAFLVYIIRNLGLGIEDTDIRIRLLEILLNSRYQVIAILSGEDNENPGDPTRSLFLRAWSDLRELIMDASERGLLSGQLLPYLSFLTAGDALVLLDETAPGLGIEISENGLRRLARSMRPSDQNDPLKFDWYQDPFLQDLFDLNAPQSSPPENQPVLPTSQLPGWLDFLIPAAQAEVLPDHLQRLSERLDPWVPQADELDVYRITVAALLETVRAQEMPLAQLTTAESTNFRHLVFTTALIESCWRQYTIRDDTISYVRSPSGSIGLMQINPSVWRGIFDIERLKNQTGYNATAGTRILLRYLRHNARPIAQGNATPDALVRATYAAYNAGPRAAGRFLNAAPKSRVKQVDDKFWMLYQKLSNGGNVDLQTCNVVPAG